MKKYINILTLLVVSIVAIGFIVAPAKANYYIDSYGQIYFNQDGFILGRTAPMPATSNKPTPKTTPTPESEETEETDEVTDQDVTPTPSTTQVTKKSQKIEIKADKDELKLQFVNNDGDVVDPIETTPSSTVDIAQPAFTNTIQISGNNDAAQIIRNRVAAQTHFPLTVNLETNELIVTTPKGSKVVTVLPDQAVAHMLAANVLDQIGGKGGLNYLASLPTVSSTMDVTPTDASTTTTPEITQIAVETDTLTPTIIPTETVALEPSPTLTPDQESEQIVLTEQEDGTLTYEIPGTKTEKLLGFYKITLKRTAIVSAETGELISIQQSPTDTILDILSR